MVSANFPETGRHGFTAYGICLTLLDESSSWGA
ncbi:uncharacterized protein CPUR_08833 [Claviceps purpurea 20.1]|uniref:Uncharacterized protein n=1 Tax=Claviceps purpurea (strain 20.1) TaxID=1111077 RepID=M1WIQ6_CLAP2|nr:uncharacterized protein CPUR_08833 [Claviceps purpurea 20.1]